MSARYQKNSRTAKELEKEMDTLSQTSQSLPQRELSQKGVRNVVVKGSLLSKKIHHQADQGNKAQCFTQQALYKYKNFRKQHGEERYILETHSIQHIQDYVENLRMNEAEACEKSLDIFTFNDREFNSQVNPRKLVHRSEAQPISRSLAEVIDHIKFVRAPYICEEPHKYTFLKEVVLTQNLIQGNLASTHFLNALALVSSDERLLKKLCCEEPLSDGLNKGRENGIFTFRMFKNRTQKYTVIVDDFIPCVTLSNGKPVPCFSRCIEPNSLWVSLVEKAYAKLNGCYLSIEHITLREAISDLSGLEPEIIPFIDKDQLNQNSFLPALEFLRANRSIVGFLKLGGIRKGDGPLDSRIYVLKQINSREGKVVLLNCWHGSNLKQQAEETLQAGEVELSTEELFKLFNTIVILKDFPDDFRGVKFEVNLSPSNGLPNTTNTQWINNPQIIFELTDREPALLTIQLSLMSGIELVEHLQLGFALFSVPEKERNVKQVNFTSMMLNVRSGDKGDCDERFVNGSTKLEKGRYAIIPFSHLKGVSGILLVLEVNYSCRDSAIRFAEQNEKILEFCLNDNSECVSRILRDKTRRDSFAVEARNFFDDQSLFTADILVPGLAKTFLLSSPSTLQSILRSAEHRRFQQLNRNLTACSVGLKDALLNNHQGTIANELILGIGSSDDREEQKYSEKDQHVADQLRYENQFKFDLSFYGLQDSGLEAVVRTIISEKGIEELLLAGNNLTCEGVVYLCYELEKSHHLELHTLDLSENVIGKKGAESLIVFISRMPRLNILNLQDNPELTRQFYNLPNFAATYLRTYQRRLQSS